MIRMQAPEGITGFSHQGYQIDIENGFVVCDPRHRADFESHGFVHAPKNNQQVARPEPVRPNEEAPPAPALDVDPRALAFANRLSTLSDDQFERLLAAVTAPLPSAVPAAKPAIFEPVQQLPAEPVEEDEQADKPADYLTDEQISSMNKNQLAKWLSDHGVPALPPITIEDLREKARKFREG